MFRLFALQTKADIINLQANLKYSIPSIDGMGFETTEQDNSYTSLRLSFGTNIQPALYCFTVMAKNPTRKTLI
jgi:hypothetical protein